MVEVLIKTINGVTLPKPKKTQAITPQEARRLAERHNWSGSFIFNGVRLPLQYK